MKPLVLYVLLSGTAVLGFQAYADETPSNPTMSDHQMLADCMERQKTSGVTQSKAQMKRLCTDELKKQKATGAMPVPPTDAPRN